VSAQFKKEDDSNYEVEKTEPVIEFQTRDDFFKLFEKFITETEKGTRTTEKGKALGKDSIQVAKTTKKHLENFAKEKKYRLTFDNINKDFYAQFCNYLYDDLDHYDNTVGKYIRNIKTFLNWSEKCTEHNKKYFKVPSEEKDIVVILPEQLNFLIDTHITEESVKAYYIANKIPIQKESFHLTVEMLQRTKDILVLGCTTTLRVGDLLKLRKHYNLLVGGSNYKIKVTTEKTSTPILIDLPDYACAILDKYMDKEGEYLIPKISEQRFNENLKKLGRLLGLDKIMVPVTKHKRFKSVTVLIAFSELLTSHIMRRTGITTLLIAGMNEYAVKKISGHTKDSRSFTKYVAFSLAYINNAFQGAWKNIREMGYGKTHMKVS
jgi:integrase